MVELAIRFHAWKDKHKRSKRWVGWCYHGAPKDYRKPYTRRFRRKESRLLFRWLKGELELDMLIGQLPYNHRHKANWDYW